MSVENSPIDSKGAQPPVDPPLSPPLTPTKMQWTPLIKHDYCELCECTVTVNHLCYVFDRHGPLHPCTRCWTEMKRQGNLIVFPDHAAALDELDALEEEAEDEEPTTPDAYEPPTSPPPAPRKRARDETEPTERPVPDTVDEVEAQVAEDLAPLSMLALVGPDLASEVLSAVIASRIRRYNL